MSTKQLTNIFNFSTFKLRAYRSYGETTETVLIHLVIDNGENTFEHIVDLDKLEDKNGYKELKVLLNFSLMLTKKDLQNIRKTLISFANNTNEMIYRYDGYTTERIHKHVLMLIKQEDVVKQDDNFIHVSVDTLNSFIESNQYLYNRHYEEVLLQLIYDGYTHYYSDGSTGYYKIKLNKEEAQG